MTTATTDRRITPGLVDILEAADYLSLGRTMVYRLMNSGELASVKIGRRRLIPLQSLEDYLQAKTASAHKNARATRRRSA